MCHLVKFRSSEREKLALYVVHIHRRQKRRQAIHKKVFATRKRKNVKAYTICKRLLLHKICTFFFSIYSSDVNKDILKYTIRNIITK